MKFQLGHWMMKPNVQPLFAVEYYKSSSKDGALSILAPCTRVTSRGATMAPALNVTLTSPREGVIGITLSHHRGAVDQGPHFPLNREAVAPDILETETHIEYRSGNLTARVDKRPGQWGIDFLSDGCYLTGTGFRAMAHMRDTESGKCFMQEALELSVGENIYGLGERFTPFVKNGQVVEMWQGDGGSCSELAYKNVPFYLSSRGYGVFVDNAGDVAYEVGSENVERVQFAVEAETLTYYVIDGPAPREVLTRYTALLGKPALPPAWSFGLWLSTSFTTNYDEATVTSFIQGMADRNIPLSVFHFDCFWMRGFQWCDFLWDPETFPDPDSMIQRLKARGLKLCVWLNPYIAQNSHLFDEGMEKGYLLRREDGSVWQTDLWQAGMALVDFTNPDACEWYRSKLRPLLQSGIDCFKTDFGERVPVKGIRYFDGSDPVKMHNYYTQLYNETVFGLLEETRGVGDAVVFARSATAGGQMLPVHWGGDNSATYVSMAETLRAGLSLSACGFGFWSHDISGFEATAPAHVYKRWVAFGLLSSHSRLHGSQSYRVPWLFDDEASDVVRRFVNLKCTLMPYLYEMACIAHEQGIPMMRPMFVEFPDDPGAAALDRQYMLGDSLLVAPVFSEDGEVSYYLPEGTWTNYLDGRVVKGGRWMKDVCDFMTVPLWVRDNAIIAVGQNDQRPDYDYADGVTIKVYHLDEGRTITARIPDLKGNTVATVTAVNEGGSVRATVTGTENYRIEVID